MAKSDLLTIPGIGRTFVQDFARIGVVSISDLVGRDPDQLYDALRDANDAVDHKTSKNYLYVLRMAVYYAEGGRDESKLKWNAWKD
jgi:nucleotidyltransferase/DNA polymerase involved in DNA repair